MSKVQILTDAAFKDEVIGSKLPVLVDFWAPWCAPCRMMGPTLEEVAKEYKGKVKIGKINVDENGLSAANYNVQSIPYLAIFKGGKIVKETIGVIPKAALKEILDRVLL